MTSLAFTAPARPFSHADLRVGASACGPGSRGQESAGAAPGPSASWVAEAWALTMGCWGHHAVLLGT